MNLKVLNELDRILKHNPELYTNNQSLCQVINGVFNISLTSIDSNNITEIAEQKVEETVRVSRANSYSLSVSMEDVG